MSQIVWIFSLCISPPLAGAEEYELWKQGRQYWYQDKWEKAAETYLELIEKYPDSPRRCKSENYLGYCYTKMGEKEKAFDVFSKIIKNTDCRSETIIDAKSERLKIAHDLTSEQPAKKKVLLEALSDSNPDIRMISAVWLSELGDNSGIETFFEILKTEEDIDRRDTAIKHILKLGTQLEKERLEKIIEEFKEQSRSAPKMVRLIIRDLKDKQEKLKLNLPISLINVAVRALSPEQIEQIKNEWNIDLKNPNFDLEKFERGKLLFRVVDGNQEIKLFLE